MLPVPPPSESHGRRVPALQEDAQGELAADASTSKLPALGRRRRLLVAHSFNPRLLLVRLLSAGCTAILTVFITPWLRFVDPTWWKLLVLGAVFGAVNAVVKPALQFLMLRFIIGSYGLVLVAINTLVLWILDLISDGFIAIENVVGLVLGGLLLGIVGRIFDTLLGVNPPMLDQRFDERKDDA